MSALSTERLFLCKQHKPEIYVDNAELLASDIINGIRFLYAKFKKDTPGVILNNYGKSAHKIVVCFLQAIKLLLNKQVLIICNGVNDLQNWRNIFQSWESDDLIFESSNPFIKKKVFINTLKDIPLLSRQNWSIVIVEDNSFSKEILRADLNASYKIWLLSVGLKSGLENVFQVYSWLYPKKDKYDIQKFIPSNNTSDRINKTILFNTFFEDILISNSNILGTSKEPIASEAKTNVPRKKMKDITGKKIKCSKRPHNDNKVHDIIKSKSESDFFPKFSEYSNGSSNTNKFNIRNENTLSPTDDPQENMECTAMRFHNTQEENLPTKDDSMESQELNFENALHDLVTTASFQVEEDSIKIQYRDAVNVCKGKPLTASPSKNLNSETVQSLIEEKGVEDSKIIPVNKSSSLESKLKELEEKALKKFKGSFLDSIF